MKETFLPVAEMSPMEFFDHCRELHSTLRIFRTMNHAKDHKSRDCGHIHAESTSPEGSDA